MFVFLSKIIIRYFRDIQQLEAISSKISIENFGFKTSWCCCWILTFLTVDFGGEAFLLLLQKINCISYPSIFHQLEKTYQKRWKYGSTVLSTHNIFMVPIFMTSSFPKSQKESMKKRFARCKRHKPLLKTKLLRMHGLGCAHPGWATADICRLGMTRFFPPEEHRLQRKQAGWITQSSVLENVFH